MTIFADFKKYSYLCAVHFDARNFLLIHFSNYHIEKKKEH